jgi:hypothetical protein
MTYDGRIGPNKGSPTVFKIILKSYFKNSRQTLVYTETAIPSHNLIRFFVGLSI